MRARFPGDDVEVEDKENVLPEGAARVIKTGGGRLVVPLSSQPHLDWKDIHPELFEAPDVIPEAAVKSYAEKDLRLLSEEERSEIENILRENWGPSSVIYQPGDSVPVEVASVPSIFKSFGDTFTVVNENGETLQEGNSVTHMFGGTA